jgi:Flp pilus assembly protein TadD
MKITAQRKAERSFLKVILGLLAVAGTLFGAQSQQKTPKAPVKSPSHEKEDPLAPLLQQAKEAIDKLDFASALDPLQQYIAQRPDEPYPHFQLGYAYAGLKRQDDAKAEFSRAIALDPKTAAAHLNLGLVLMESDPGAAAESFRRAAELQPTESRTRFLAGYSLERAGKFTEAAEQYRGALGISPNDYEIHFALGRVLLRTNDAPGAEEQFRAAVAARADSAPARLGLANTLLAQNKYDAASDALGEYLKLNPGDRPAHFDRASALLNLNRYDDALAELDRAESGSVLTPETIKMRGEIYMQQKKWKEAGQTLTQAIRSSPKDVEVAAWLGHVDIELHDYPGAASILGQVYKQDPQSTAVLRDLANAFFLNEDYPAALGAMDSLAKLEPSNAGTWFVRAICYDKLSRKVEAIDAYQKFLDLDNEQHDNQDIEARHRMAALQRELKQEGKKR